MKWLGSGYAEGATYLKKTISTWNSTGGERELTEPRSLSHTPTGVDRKAVTGPQATLSFEEEAVKGTLQNDECAHGLSTGDQSRAGLTVGKHSASSYATAAAGLNF